MLTALLITLLIVAALGYALAASAGDAGAILRRPYNNRYSDAAGAREDYVG